MVNFLKDKFGVKTEEEKKTVVTEEPVKVIDLKKLSNKLDNIEVE